MAPASRAGHRRAVPTVCGDSTWRSPQDRLNCAALRRARFDLPGGATSGGRRSSPCPSGHTGVPVGRGSSVAGVGRYSGVLPRRRAANEAAAYCDHRRRGMQHGRCASPRRCSTTRAGAFTRQSRIESGGHFHSRRLSITSRPGTTRARRSVVAEGGTRRQRARLRCGSGREEGSCDRAGGGQDRGATGGGSARWSAADDARWGRTGAA
jgi:hypothetical protein